MSWWFRTRAKDGTAKFWAIDLPLSPLVLPLVPVLITVCVVSAIRGSSPARVLPSSGLLCAGLCLYWVSRRSRGRAQSSGVHFASARDLLAMALAMLGLTWWFVVR